MLTLPPSLSIIWTTPARSLLPAKRSYAASLVFWMPALLAPVLMGGFVRLAHTGMCWASSEAVELRVNLVSGPDAGLVDGTVSVSRRTPNRNSLPSLRQFRAIAGNCSRSHLTVMREPTEGGGRLIRTHAPDLEVSSRMAGARKDVPPSSSHVISATAHINFRGSI